MESLSNLKRWAARKLYPSDYEKVLHFKKMHDEQTRLRYVVQAILVKEIKENKRVHTAVSQMRKLCSHDVHHFGGTEVLKRKIIFMCDNIEDAKLAEQRAKAHITSDDCDDPLYGNYDGE